MAEIGTYTNGFTIKMTRDFTKKEYIELCDLIAQKLNSLYGYNDENKISIIPEPITEGGMKFVGGPNNIYGELSGQMGHNKFYKTMRHRFFIKDHPRNNDIKWEWITDKTKENWSISNDILWPKNSESATVLKSFHKAPLWTLEELVILKECFEKYDIKCKKMPIKKSLKTLL